MHACREARLELALLLYFASEALEAQGALRAYMDMRREAAERDGVIDVVVGGKDDGGAEQLAIFAAKLQLMALAELPGL